MHGPFPAAFAQPSSGGGTLQFGRRAGAVDGCCRHHEAQINAPKQMKSAVNTRYSFPQGYSKGWETKEVLHWHAGSESKKMTLIKAYVRNRKLS